MTWFRPTKPAAREDPETVNELESYEDEFEGSVKQRDYRWTLLQYVCSVDNAAVVKLLLDRGEDPDEPDYSGMTPLHWASIAGHTVVVELLLYYRADVDARDNTNCTPLHWACYHDRYEVVRRLLQRRVDVNARNDDGRTPISLTFSIIIHR